VNNKASLKVKGSNLRSFDDTDDQLPINLGATLLYANSTIKALNKNKIMSITTKATGETFSDFNKDLISLPPPTINVWIILHKIIFLF